MGFKNQNHLVRNIINMTNRSLSLKIEPYFAWDSGERKNTLHVMLNENNIGVWTKEDGLDLSDINMYLTDAQISKIAEAAVKCSEDNSLLP